MWYPNAWPPNARFGAHGVFRWDFDLDFIESLLKSLVPILHKYILKLVENFRRN